MRIPTLSHVTLAFLVAFVLGLAGCQTNQAVRRPALERHVAATGGRPVFEILPSPAVFRDQVPSSMRDNLPPDPTPFGNRVARISGTIYVEATDRTEELLPDTPYTSDSASVQAEFLTEDGAKWRVVQTGVAARLQDGSPKLFAGVGIDKTVHGNTGKENPLMPKMKAALTMWGFADVYKNSQLVNHNALLHIMVTSRARSLDDGHYVNYDMTDQPVDEIHLFLNPGNHLPSPGGFLHINWELSQVQR